MSGSVATAQIGEKLAFLMQPGRYKVAYGGRGAGKSHAIAMWLLLESSTKPLRVLCCREFQSSIRESVHKLLSDMIERLSLTDKFLVTQTGIRGNNGSEFIFEGLRHNITRIRSLEGVDRVWVEEAQSVSDGSWNILIPTIRKEGSEIIISLNPELETDPTYERFILNPPPNAVVRKVNYHDNPWFPQVLRDEMEHLRERDPDAYQHVWLGNCKHTLEGAIYAKELRDAASEDRITSVPYDATRPVSVYFDLGWADSTSVWFVQHVAGEIRLIDFHQDQQKAFRHYLQVLQSKPYDYQTMWLPHDAQAKSLGTGRSVEEIAKAWGGSKNWRVRIVPKLSVADGINATRTLFPTMWFDHQKCRDGIQSLRYYRYEVDSSTNQFAKLPAHDHASHAADALRYVAVAMQGARQAQYRTERTRPPRVYSGERRANGQGWLRM